MIDDEDDVLDLEAPDELEDEEVEVGEEDYITTKCSMCGCPAGLFRDDISEEEFRQSGMCQACQDEVFDLEPGYHGSN